MLLLLFVKKKVLLKYGKRGLSELSQTKILMCVLVFLNFVISRMILVLVST